MIKYTIDTTPPFEEELERIYFYLSFFLHSKTVAKKLKSKINQEISRLDLFPERYSKVQNIHNKNLRKMSVSNYIIIYEVDNNSHKVFLIHIFNCRQNYLSNFKYYLFLSFQLCFVYLSYLHYIS